MREPTEHHVYDDEYQDDTGECIECDQPWPCKTWRKWTASKDYRIAQLEATVKRLSGQAARDGDKLHELESTVRDDSNILRNGIFRAISDIGRHNRMGNLSLDWTRDVEDFTLDGSPWIHRVAGRSELTVTYEDLDGGTWKNGELTDRTLRSG